MMAVTTKSANAGPAAFMRVDYLDWLRVLATLSVFLFHNARFFDAYSDWHVRNATTWIGGTIIVGFFSQWIMAIYELLIRRWNIMRFLFGMRRMNKAAQPIP
jgi:peptidoglycan/LPS O-acetylase OafA/YrhL